MERVLLTGATGALGPSLLSRLLGHPDRPRVDVLVRPSGLTVEGRVKALMGRVRGRNPDLTSAIIQPLTGDVAMPWLGLSAPMFREITSTVDVIVHAAADTRFRAPRDQQDATNVGGTANVLDLAQRSSRLRRLVLLSTTCVSGQRTGSIPEAFCTRPAGFTNNYEQSKWKSEDLARTSGLRVTVLRLSTVMGDGSGRVDRPGALHHMLDWFRRGLISAVPGVDETRVDLISSDRVCDAVEAAIVRDGSEPEVMHVAAGRRAARLEELIEVCTHAFRRLFRAWSSGQIEAPPIADAETYELLEEWVRNSGDALLTQVLDSVSSFLPTLLYPRVYDTGWIEGVGCSSGENNDHWQTTLERMIRFCHESFWHTRQGRRSVHA